MENLINDDWKGIRNFWMMVKDIYKDKDFVNVNSYPLVEKKDGWKFVRFIDIDEINDNLIIIEDEVAIQLDDLKDFELDFDELVAIDQNHFKFKGYKDKIFFARMSYHIYEDLERGWSSWNFGQEGIEATKEEMEELINECIEEEKPLFISGLELWGDDLKRQWDSGEIRQLYKNYWVVRDNTLWGLAGRRLKAKNIREAINEAPKSYFAGDGDGFTPDQVVLLWSDAEEGIHVLVTLFD